VRVNFLKDERLMIDFSSILCGSGFERILMAMKFLILLKIRG